MIDVGRLIALIEQQGTVARIAVATTHGSTPREVGSSMMVTASGQEGTIGGGALEFHAVERARAMLTDGKTNVTRKALGPALNQCCGGAVTLVTEVFDAECFAEHPHLAYIRRISDGPSDIPPRINRAIEISQTANRPVPTIFHSGWFVEPTWRLRTEAVIYGAGHVGQALATVLNPLPDLNVCVVDQRSEWRDHLDRAIRSSPDPLRSLEDAADTALHFVMTHSHTLDLELCHRLLGRPFGEAFLIGSATKWARFAKRLAMAGHAKDHIARIVCPIGDPAFGKHPQSIAVSVAAQILGRSTTSQMIKDVG